MVRPSDYPVAHTVVLDEQKAHLVHEVYRVMGNETLCGLGVREKRLDTEAAKRLALCLVCFARDLDRAPGRALRR